jgi:dihydrofolate synthase/folylpolyglutamate synthase
MYQRDGKIAYKSGLDNILEIDKLLHYSHKKFPSVHIAGTNGKGSVSHMLAAVLQCAGYKTGLFTSPHLIDFRERIKINGAMISQDAVSLFMNEYLPAFERIKPSFFEITTAMAFDYFAKEKVDIAVIEVGLGGRLDATNIITPEISVITNIGFDHTDLLGNTIELIAKEKAGIIKKGIPVVISQTQEKTEEIFNLSATENSSKIYFADQVFQADGEIHYNESYQSLIINRSGQEIYSYMNLDLLGLYQRKNICAVLKVLELLIEKGYKISKEDIHNGLAHVKELTGLMGRWQVAGHDPLIIYDNGHNEDGIRCVVDQIEKTYFRELHIIFGMVNDKPSDKVLKLLPVKAAYYFTKANIPRALDETILLKQAEKYNLIGKSYGNVKMAIQSAISNADKEDLIIVTGSSFVVAETMM